MRRDRTVVAVLAQALAGEVLPPKMLIAGDDAEEARALCGLTGQLWPLDRIPWPGNVPMHGATLRLPLARELYDMTLHAIASLIPAGAPLYVYGPNDEGIKSAPTAMVPYFADIQTLLVKGHARVWRARRSEVTTGLKARFKEWRTIVPVTIGGRCYDWVFYPGVFAFGRIDRGSALLIEHLPDVAGLGVLDYGAGTGVIARALVDRGAQVDMAEPNPTAISAAMENVREARPMEGRRLDDLPTGYDLIVSNPPIHEGKVSDRRVLNALIADAPKHLKPGGALLLVTQVTVPIDRLVGTAFKQCTVIAAADGYRAWRLSDS